MLFLWVVFIVGPAHVIPVHSVPLAWSTEEKCNEELRMLLDTGRVRIRDDSEYHLECMKVPDLRGEPA